MANEIQIVAPQSLDESERLSLSLAKSALLPDAVRGKQSDILATVLTGAELGLAPMQSLRGIQIIKGKPTLSADTMGALCKRRSDVCEYLVLKESSSTRATYETKRRGDPSPTVMSFDASDAQRAGLNGDNWRKYPAAMLRARALSAICRAVYPDLCLGLYDPDELAPEAPSGPPPERDVTPTNGSRTDAVKAALQARVSAQTVDAPKPTPPQPERKMKIVPVAEGQTEEQASAVVAGAAKASKTPHVKIGALGLLHGVTGKTLSALVKSVTGKTKAADLTEDDVSRVEAALIAESAPPPDDVPPPLEEAPF